MAGYKELKEAFQKEKKHLYNKNREIEKIISKNKRAELLINEINEEEIETVDTDKVYSLRKYFPELDDLFKLYRKITSYQKSFHDIDTDEFIKDIEICNKLYGIPPTSSIDDIKRTLNILKNIKTGNIDKISKEDMDILIQKPSKGTHLMHAYVYALCGTLSLEIMSRVIRIKEDYDEKKYLNEIKNNEDRITLIDKFNTKFSLDKLLVKFESIAELNEFTDLMKSVLDTDSCIEVLNKILVDQNTKEEEIIKVDFDNLDISKFTDYERKIIEELREIIEDETIKGDIELFDDIPITYNERASVYTHASISSILNDVNLLLDDIYDNKEVILIFKLIINLYRKDSILKIRTERVNELEKIKNDFNIIINYINRTYLNKEEAFNETKELNKYIQSIELEYLPFMFELIQNELVDGTLDDEFDKVITEYKSIIKKWKKEMTEYYQSDKQQEDYKENTDNLVMCLDNIDLSQEGYQKEFVGTINALELMSSRELKKRPGRKGMTRLRKNTENDKSIDIVKYLENKNNIHLHYVVYRYSNASDYRTGLIKFEPSSKVKSFLEERYGLSKQSAIYGVFMIISAIGADHSEYSRFQDYILNNYREIEELALLFASEKPDLEKLTNVVDEMLNNKKNMIISSQKR